MQINIFTFLSQINLKKIPHELSKTLCLIFLKHSNEWFLRRGHITNLKYVEASLIIPSSHKTQHLQPT